MRKFKFGIISMLLVFVLIGCNSDDENQQAADTENDTTNDETDNEEMDENQEEVDEVANEEEEEEENNRGISDEEKQRVLERFSDASRIGEPATFERSDITNDHVNVTLNSFKLVDELDGETPDRDHFLLVNATIENEASDEYYGSMFLRSIAEGRRGGTVQNEKEELAQEFEEGEPGISTGYLVYDIEESDYYRFSILGNKYLLFIDEIDDSEE